LARVDEGDGAPVVFVHGEPTWSFLWRTVLVPVRDAGYRCIAPDLPGFGRSDKPTDIGWYTYDRHTAALTALLEELDTGHQRMTDAWTAFRDFVERTEDLPVGFLVRGGCKNDPGEDVIAGYERPFPSVASKAGARAFPLIVAVSPESPGAEAGQRALAALRDDPRSKLMLWADSDAVLPLETGEHFAAALSGEIAHVIKDAGHFLQEDAGPQIGALIADWLTSA
jgi:haloalkane dehalogenase